MSPLRYIEEVVTLKLDRDACSGCGMCIKVCPHEVFTLREKRAEIIDLDACIECGACALNCPDHALSVTPGVGCVSAILTGWITGKEPTCGCEDDPSLCC